VLSEATERGFAIDDVATQTLRGSDGGDAGADGRPPTIEVTLHVHGRRPVTELAAALSDLEAVNAVLATDVNAIDE
jgi:acetolactate synthase regulatory subunit